MTRPFAPRHRLRGALWLAACATLPLLGACSDKDAELRAQIAAIKAAKPPQIKPIKTIAPYEPFTYVVGSRRDPFQSTDLIGGEAPAAISDDGLRPDLTRNREPLEAFPIDALRMLGIIKVSGSTFALISAPDNLIHRVSIGNYLGQNYGQITQINELEVALTELVPDGFGGWVQRPASLALAE